MEESHKAASNKKHFVLVHGSCHGAWCWYKVVASLKSSGHRATAVDLGSSGVSERRIDQIDTIFDYSRPLMEVVESVPRHEKVVLVGHSYAGLCISLAMESFPEKISVAVFVAAYMPNYNSPPATYIHQFLRRTQLETFMDCKFSFGLVPEKPPTSVIFGPNYMEAKLYAHCQPEDLELAKMLIRPSGLFIDDLEKDHLLTEGRFGSVSRVFLVCEEDEVMPEEFQLWMIDNTASITEVMTIEKAGHMVMLSKSKELCRLFQEIADKYD